MTWDPVIPDESGDYERVEQGVHGETRYLDAQGRLHRISGPAIVWPSQRQDWYEHGFRHRLDGPAIVHPNGDCEFYAYDLRHRLDGPAVVHSDGRIEYWLDDVELTEAEFREWLGPSQPPGGHGALRCLAPEQGDE